LPRTPRVIYLFCFQLITGIVVFGTRLAKEFRELENSLGADEADGVSMVLGLGWDALGLGGGECSRSAQRFPGIIDYFDHCLGLMPAPEQEGR
jgi:hypothetical protein